MKKYLCLPFLVAILFLLSCGKENSPSSEIVRVELPPLLPEFVVDGIEPKPLGYLKTISFPQLIKKGLCTWLKPEREQRLLKSKEQNYHKKTSTCLKTVFLENAIWKSWPYMAPQADLQKAKWRYIEPPSTN